MSDLLVEVNEVILYWLPTIFTCLFSFVDNGCEIPEVGIFQCFGQLPGTPIFVSLFVGLLDLLKNTQAFF